METLSGGNNSSPPHPLPLYFLFFLPSPSSLQNIIIFIFKILEQMYIIFIFKILELM